MMACKCTDGYTWEHECAQGRPDGLYVVRSGVATAVTKYAMAKAMHVSSAMSLAWWDMNPGYRDIVKIEAERIIAALTQAQGDAE